MIEIEIERIMKNLAISVSSSMLAVLSLAPSKVGSCLSIAEPEQKQLKKKGGWQLH